MKSCYKCKQEKDLEQFHKHPGMSDGHLNKCKVCARQDAIQYRLTKLEFWREHDRQRGSRQSIEYIRKYRERFPKKYVAHNLINNYIRDGKIIKMPCEICGNTQSQAHHDDYDLPLEVRWLCSEHHHAWHMVNGEGQHAK
jgi:hypothetical protein